MPSNGTSGVPGRVARFRRRARRGVMELNWGFAAGAGIGLIAFLIAHLWETRDRKRRRKSPSEIAEIERRNRERL